MSNPAPTLNQINAFNATQGTTIDFNIIGGTEVIRSNKIYIYDLSDNSLICTHLYVSTESIHELPPNTSSSIVYASGKSSADFTNNTQYYAQIQTFTDVGGTQGGSGLSIAKLFWCLPTPTLTLSTIPTTISTTSYNVSATYTPNTSGGATNEIQEFQFNLYSAIGALLQTSGVVLYGESVDLSYNFSGLEVDSTYYVTLDVTTTQGMNVSAQSNTFTVSIDTPTIGSASVVNNGCDGYISVTSNLSSEYEHEESAEAGEIISFTTDSVDNITELDVDFSPVQDDTPWMSTQNTEPYMFRVVPTQTEDFGHESDTIVGGTVAWNQLIPVANKNYTNSVETDTRNYFQFTIQSVSVNPVTTYFSRSPLTTGKLEAIFNATNAGSGIRIKHNGQSHDLILYINNNFTLSGNHKYLISADVKSVDVTVVGGVDIQNIMLIDLTQMFGSTIADYVYSLETANAGAGVAWFRKLFPNAYYEYNAGELISVNGLESHDMVGKNQYDYVTNPLIGIWANETTKIISTSQNAFSAVISCLPNTTYTITKTLASRLRVSWTCEYPVSGVQSYGYINRDGYATATITTGADAKYIVAYVWYATQDTSITKEQMAQSVQIEIGSTATAYEPYVKHSYPLDSDLTLRGIPKLDSNNNLYYDGDEYRSDGGVTRKWGFYTIQTSDITLDDGGGYTNVVCAKIQNLPSMLKTNTKQAIHSKYGVAQVVWPFDDTSNIGKFANNPATQAYWFIFPVDTTIEQMRTALVGTTVVYELATPTTETADPFTNPQVVDPSGTEEYVGSPIPVGHKTTYQRICPITGWTGCEVFVRGVNQWDEETQKGYYNGTTGAYISDPIQICSVNPIPVQPSTSYYIKTPSALRLCYYKEDMTFISAENKKDQVITTPAECKFVHINTFASPAYPSGTTYNHDISLNYPSTDHDYHAYNGTTYPVSWQTEAGTVYGGTVDLVSGVLTINMASVDLGSLSWSYDSTNKFFWSNSLTSLVKRPSAVTEVVSGINCSYYQVARHASTGMILSYGAGDATWANVATGSIAWHLSSLTNPLYVYVKDTAYTDATTFKNAMKGVQLVYELATPIEISLTPQQIQTLSGQNNIWSNTNGGMYLVYQLPITSLLVKRRDVADVSGKWLTLYSVPITQASDMDFTFIDFLNQYGKKYQYALVPVLAQDQSGVIVQIEGGYTVSDNVDSIFDGVYIADQTNVERVKAGVGYGNIDMNQGVGSITPIGSKYPIVITNSQNQYHNGSIRGTIVPNDFYSNGNLSRIDMVNKRDELEQFLTNKRAKIIKDWNGKMWLVMIMSNVSCSFDDNYGMGMVSFSADWLEVGDPTNQQDLYNAGLINVGGV